MYSYFSTNAKKRLCLCFMFIWPSVYAQHCQNLRTGLYFTSFREKYSENKSISFGLIRMCNFSSHICSNFKNRILVTPPVWEIWTCRRSVCSEAGRSMSLTDGGVRLQFWKALHAILRLISTNCWNADWNHSAHCVEGKRLRDRQQQVTNHVAFCPRESLWQDS